MAAALTFGTPAAAWWGDTHGLLTQAAVAALPESVPAFFRAGGGMAAHVALDPDVAKNRDAPHLSHQEFPEHFADIELLQGHDLPSRRYDFVALCRRIGVAPEKVGFAPYAITETTERLAVAFAEHRKWPASPEVQAKCLVYAGFLAHYAQDIVQPLHATIHYDGRLQADGERSGAGIHERVDSIIQRLGWTAQQLGDPVVAASFEGDLFAAVAAQVLESNSQVDRVYELADELDPVSPAATELARERARRAVTFTAALYVTAWERSADIRLPGWLRR